MKKIKCFKCEHEWLPRSERPISCPYCHSHKWDVKGYVKCEVCNRNFLNISTHHKDGNVKNNFKSNLIKLCSDCHSMVHNEPEPKTKTKGKTKIRKYLDKKSLIKIKELKTFLFMEKKKTK